MTVEAVVEDDRWLALDIETLAERAVRAALRHLGVDPDAVTVGLLAADDARIAGLNAAFRGRPAPTNVLSWPSVERAAPAPGRPPAPPDLDERELGDIALAYETCRREAAGAGIPSADHVAHLLIHGTLHLLGYDHEDDADADLMERLEVEILASIGLPNPYCADPDA